MRTRNLIWSIAAFSGLVLPLLSCGKSQHEATEVYYLVTANAKISYWQAAAAGLENAAREFQVGWQVVGPANWDPNAEKEAFQKVLRGKPTGILVSPADPELLRPEIDQAIAQGIPVITIDSDAPASKRLLFIGTNNYQAGQMGGRVVANKLGGKGTVVVYTTPAQVNLQERLHGYEEVFRTTGIKPEIIDMKGDPRNAFDRTMDMFDKGKPADAFVCLEATACPEVADVLARKNATGKTVVAMDTDPRTLDAIDKGQIVATIAQKPYTMAYFGTKLLDQLHHHPPASLQLDWANDTRSPLPSFVDTGATLINKGNLDAFTKANTANSATKQQ